MNPYTARLLDLLGSRDPLAVAAETPRRLSDLAARIGSGHLERAYAPGKWTARMILAHLADVEMTVGFRVRQTLALDDAPIQPIDQDAWARRYGSADAALGLGAHEALRRWNLSLFRTLGPGDRARVARHPERGEESVDRMIRLLAGHDLNHLGQLEAIAEAASASA